MDHKNVNFYDHPPSSLYWSDRADWTVIKQTPTINKLVVLRDFMKTVIISNQEKTSFNSILYYSHLYFLVSPDFTESWKAVLDPLKSNLMIVITEPGRNRRLLGVERELDIISLL